MPSKGVARRLGKRKRERNLHKRQRRELRGQELRLVGLPAATVRVCSCGFVGKTAAGLKVHQTRKGHKVPDDH